MKAEHRLLILGTGSIAHRHAEQFAILPGIALVAAVDTDLARAQAFAELHGIPNAFASLEESLSWGAFDAAVNATPDLAHRPTTLALLAAGKHVFCEKPLDVDYPGAIEMTRAAQTAGLLNMVNLTYRNARALQAARAMIADGAIGAVRHVEASYLQSWLSGTHWGDWRTDPRWLWRLSTAHGSRGVVGDIGIHLLDFVTFGTSLDVVALQARLATFAKAPRNRIGDYALDANDSAVLTAELSNGALAAIHMSRFATGKLNDLELTVHGERGALRVWANHAESHLSACLGPDIETQVWKTLPCPPTPRNEARFAQALATGVNGQPDFLHAANVQALLDLCFESNEQGRMLAVGRREAGEGPGRIGDAA